MLSSRRLAAMALRAREAQRLHRLLSEAIAAISWRPLSSRSAAGGGREFAGKSAYEVLGLPETSSFTKIKASFRRLAKETHPDLASSPGGDGGAASQRFLQILAAYEILSDSKRRAHYDAYLFSGRRNLQKQPIPNSTMYTSSSSVVTMKQSDVVDWLKWYRLVIDDIVIQKKVATGTGYFAELENELYSAIRTAYYGPLIESMDLLPDCFEAEERSTYETSEVLHLVSGRDLFGVVNVVDKVPELFHSRRGNLGSLDSMTSEMCEYAKQNMVDTSSGSSESVHIHEKEVERDNNIQSDVYKDLELHICGKVVAMATRSPKCECFGVPTMDSEDHIHVYRASDHTPNTTLPGSVGSRTLLGTIIGLGDGAEEGCCSVYDGNGTKTHMLVKHRTLLVKHLHWYQVGGGLSACECRCSRARLPPSKFWLFEPRSIMHDIGGWYVETFDRDRKGRTIQSQRHWDNVIEHPDRRLHPAVYLLAMAYRTLDLEDAKRRKQRFRNFVEPKLYSILHWYKKFL